MKEQHLTVSKTARYYTLGSLTDKTRHVWFVLHGWGMNAKDFLASLEPLVNDTVFMVAPEALNRFYLKGSGGQVGATWMTKEDRLNEISDYINYLDSLYRNFAGSIPAGAVVTALGFSQGAATVTRWVNAGNCSIHSLVVFAGEVAPELLPLSDNSGLKKTSNYFMCGTHDHIFTPPIVTEMKQKYAELNFDYTDFTGRHEINTQVLEKLLR
jgi:predicted esterase